MNSGLLLTLGVEREASNERSKRRSESLHAYTIPKLPKDQESDHKFKENPNEAYQTLLTKRNDEAYASWVDPQPGETCRPHRKWDSPLLQTGISGVVPPTVIPTLIWADCRADGFRSAHQGRSGEARLSTARAGYEVGTTCSLDRCGPCGSEVALDLDVLESRPRSATCIRVSKTSVCGVPKGGHRRERLRGGGPVALLESARGQPVILYSPFVCSRIDCSMPSATISNLEVPISPSECRAGGDRMCPADGA